MMHSICTRHELCKCCGAQAKLYGVTDFNKSCLSAQNQLPPVGIPIYYYRCAKCLLIFTNAFDHFTVEDFQTYIYNDDYELVDPDYKEKRPQHTATSLASMFPSLKPSHSLDYGGGDGLLAKLLHESGFERVDSYDPIMQPNTSRPTKKFDFISCVEVAEHCVHPRRLFDELSSLLDDPGVVVLTTLLQPDNLSDHDLSWWYIAPRNGHISLYSREALHHLAKEFGLKVGSFDNNMHVLCRNIPNFARHCMIEK